MPRTARDVVDDLHALLAAAGVPGPYILVGHSLGGLFAIPATVAPERGAQLEQAWREATSDLIALRPQTPHIFATGSDHFVQIHQPDVVVAAVGLAMRRSTPHR